MKKIKFTCMDLGGEEQVRIVDEVSEAFGGRMVKVVKGEEVLHINVEALMGFVVEEVEA